MKSVEVNETAKQIEDRLGINWSPAQKQAYLDSIKTVYLKRLETPYPIHDFFMAGTQKAQDEWDAYWEGKPLKDPRYNKGLRRKTKTIDHSQLQYIIEQDESVQFRDADTEELVMVVLRDFFPDEDMREAFTKICLEVVDRRRNDRREDPGQLCHFGYTCGSRHQPELRLATCNKRLNTPARVEHERQLNYRAQGMAGLGWNMLKSRLPDEIIQDYEDVIRRVGAPRMDMQRKEKNFSFPFHGKSVTFEGLDLPPPSGVCAINYSRFTHKENNGNRFFIACTTEAPADPTKGGNFYNASYGIMLKAATNTVTSWRPTDYHGTTLYEMVEGPKKRLGRARAGHEIRPDGGINTGFSFEVSKMIRNAVKQALKRKNAPPASSSASTSSTSLTSSAEEEIRVRQPPPSKKPRLRRSTSSAEEEEEITVRQPPPAKKPHLRRHRQYAVNAATADDSDNHFSSGSDSDSDYVP
ncbi:hypothetical protein PGQ11_015244 [Apiospora arundinis]|uniref:Uncharacterized protein n=1 Tax=Apiospora arundinis TaxID=335852 RepID=A0ABR2HKY7_9PEZI